MCFISLIQCLPAPECFRSDSAGSDEKNERRPARFAFKSADVAAFAIVIESKGFAVGTLGHCGVCFVSTDLNLIQSTEVSFTVMVLALLYRACDVVICFFVFHNITLSVQY